jgi:hypothetical protein
VSDQHTIPTQRDLSRVAGWYWVRCHGETEWDLARWVPPLADWSGYWVPGIGQGIRVSTVYAEIDERRIVREDPRQFQVSIGEDGTVRYGELTDG